MATLFRPDFSHMFPPTRGGGGGQWGAPPPSPEQSRQPQQQQDQIAHLLQYAQTSYTSHPTDALSALMEALTLHNGANAAQHAIDRIRYELGDAVADCVAGNVTSHHQSQQQHHDNNSNNMQQTNSQLSDQDILTQRAMQIVQEMLNDESTFLHAQGRQHLLQQAMEDGSSVVCTKCGDMIKVSQFQFISKFR